MKKYKPYKKNLAPVAPVTMQSLMSKHPEMTKAVENFEYDIRKESGNRGLNMMLAAMLIQLHRKYEFGQEELKRIADGALSQCELIWQRIISFEELMKVCEKIGFETVDVDHEKIKHSSDRVMEFINQYEEMKEEMSKRDEVFKCMDDGIRETVEIAKLTGIKKSTIESYKSLWEKEQKKKSAPQTDDELADLLFGGEDKEEVGEEDHIADAGEMVEVTSEENTTVEEKEEEVEVMEEKQMIKKGLKITRRIEIEGTFGNYAIANKVVDVKLETIDMGLEKEQLLELIEELQAVAQEM